MRVDAHQHFWRFAPEAYPWITAEMAVLRRDWLPDDLRPLLSAHRIGRSVAVQARASEHETDALLGFASQHDWIGAVIGWANLRGDDLAARLESWSEHPAFAGVRHQVQHEPDAAAFLSDAAMLRGVRELQTRSLVYEVLVYASQLPAVPAFCAACDGYWLVLDHLGKPSVRTGDLDRWRRAVAPLAAMPHVACKVSGLVTEAISDDGTRQFDALPAYLDAALELFGPNRLMFGSDWPVCLLAATYREVVDIVDRWAERLSTTEREALWGGTAARVYARALEANA